MIEILERIGFVKKENNNNFKMIPAIVILLLMLCFVGTTFYVLISGLDW